MPAQLLAMTSDSNDTSPPVYAIYFNLSAVQRNLFGGFAHDSYVNVNAGARIEILVRRSQSAEI